MPKKKRKSTKRHLHAVDSPPRPSLAALRNGKMLDSLTPDFVEWFGEPEGDPTEALACLNLVRSQLIACADVDPETTATSFPPWAVEDTLQILEIAAAQEGGDPTSVIEAWHEYLHYLGERGRWTGTEAAFAECHEILSSLDGLDEAVLPEIEVPGLSVAEQARGFADIVLVRHARSLLEWIGDGRQATGTGALRLKDVPAAAAVVGVTVRVPASRKRASEALPGLAEPDTADAQAPLVRSMHDVPLLSPLWRVLEDAELISVMAGSVRRTERAELLIQGVTAEQVGVSRDLVLDFLRAQMQLEPTFMGFEEEIATVVLTVLVAGTTQQAVQKAQLAEVATAPPAGELFGDHYPDLYRAAIGQSVQTTLDRLVGLGLLVPGPDYVVAPVVVQCVAALAEEILGAADDDEGQDGEGGLLEIAPRGAAVPTRAPEGTTDRRIYQLKIGLQGAQPPIWRRVLVPSTLRLDELHQVIQQCFDWRDAHLHAFEVVRGRNSMFYEPAGPFGPVEGFGEDPEGPDEAGAVLGEVLRGSGTKLNYTYDFGDSWEHRIELEKILDDDGRNLPVCTGGRRAAPVEDSGGVWGWAQLLQTVADPADEDYEQMREWLALEPGEVLDGQTFDQASVNRRLADLRR